MGLTLPPKLPRFHPATRIRSMGEGEPDFTIADAACHVNILGATGGGKTSGSGEFFAKGYLGSAAEMGMLILCAQPGDAAQWIRWAAETGRSNDVRVFDASGDRYRFNFLDWFSGFAGKGRGSPSTWSRCWKRSSPPCSRSEARGAATTSSGRTRCISSWSPVLLVQLAGYELSLPTMRDIVRSAPLSREQANDPNMARGERLLVFSGESARALRGKGRGNAKPITRSAAPTGSTISPISRENALHHHADVHQACAAFHDAALAQTALHRHHA